jgi:FK506-binding nuclear protein
MCYFKVTGPYKVYLTGNFVIPPDADEDGDEDDEDEDDSDLLLPDEIDEYMDDDESEEDELDALEDPRIAEVDDEEEAPKLVKAGKGKNKRPAEEFEEDSDDEEVAEDILQKILKPEPAATNGQEKLSKKQKKKLKNNAGEAVPAAAGAEKKEDVKASPANGKKVQFAKNLEQGPTPTKADAKADSKPGVKNVGGVTIDDKKIGSGKQAKKGTKVELRYIGKLKNGKVFDGKSFPVLRASTRMLTTQQPTRRASHSASRSAPAKSFKAWTLASRA